MSSLEIAQLVELLAQGFDVEEAAITESMVGDLRGSVPVGQLVEEIGLAIAIHRRRGGKSKSRQE